MVACDYVLAHTPSCARREAGHSAPTLTLDSGETLRFSTHENGYKLLFQPLFWGNLLRRR